MKLSKPETNPNFEPSYSPGERQAVAEEGPATAQFDREIETLTQRRGAIYGHPAVDFGRASEMKSVIADCPDPRLRHVLDMIATKMARLIHTPDHLDSWNDIAGYARTACMVIDAMEKKHDII